MLRKSVLYKILLLINVFFVITLLISLSGSVLSPVKFLLPIYFILGFPILIIINIFFLILWLSLKRWYFLVSLIALLISSKQITTVFPINFQNNGIVIISAKVSHHSGKVSHLKKLGGFVCKYTNLFDISFSQRFSLEFKPMSRG